MGEMKESVDQVMNMMNELSNYEPKAMRDFKAFMGNVLKEGTLDTKTKELIAIGTSITARCKYCIAIHVEKALKLRMKNNPNEDQANNYTSLRD